jgi:hypothetical protein
VRVLRHYLLAAWPVLLTGCGDETRCPPTERPARPVDPAWCTGIYRSGGWGPIVAVIVVAAITVGVTFMLVRKRPGRTWVLAVVGYLMTGVVSTTIGNASIGGSLEGMTSDPLPHLLQVLAWPVFLMTYVSGNYGR